MARGMLGNFQFIFATFSFVLFLNRYVRSDFVLGLGEVDLSLIMNLSSPILTRIQQGPTRFRDQSYHLEIKFHFFSFANTGKPFGYDNSHIGGLDERNLSSSTFQMNGLLKNPLHRVRFHMTINAACRRIPKNTKTA